MDGARIEAQKLMRKVALRKGDVCGLDATNFETLRIRYNCNTTPDLPFSKALNELGCCKRRPSVSGQRVQVWCLTCSHSNYTGEEEDEEEEEEEEEEETTPQRAKRRSEPGGSTPRSPEKRHKPNRSPSQCGVELFPDADSPALHVTGRPAHTHQQRKKKVAAQHQKILRQDDRVELLQQEIETLKQEIVRLTNLTIPTKTHGASPQGDRWHLPIKMLCIQLRSHGIGLDSTRSILASQLELWTGEKMEPPAVSTIGEWDWVSGPLSFVPFCEAMKVRNAGKKWGTTCSQDSASGSRGAKGYTPSAFALNVADWKTPNTVRQVIGHVTVGENGRDATKAAQLDEFRTACKDMHIPVAHWVNCVDHAATGIGASAKDAVPSTGCSSHKMSNTVGGMQQAASFFLHKAKGMKSMKEMKEDPLEKALRTFATASDASATASTTNTGLINRSRAAVEGGGRAKKGFKVTREVGTRYGWAATNAYNLFSRFEEAEAQVRRGEMLIPGSEALDLLLKDPTMLLQMSACVLIHSWMSAVFVATKKGGVKNVKTARSGYGGLREKIVSLQCVATSDTDPLTFPSWVETTKTRPAVAKALKVAGRTQAIRRRFRKMMAAVVEEGCATWDRFVAKDADLSHIPEEYLLATPASNDFVEGYHGTFSMLFDRLGLHTTPPRIAMLAMYRHNIGTLESTGFSTQSVTPEIWDAAVRYSTFFKEKNVKVQGRVHSTASVSKICAKLKDTCYLDIKEQCEERGIVYTTKSDTIPELARYLYDEGDVPKPS